MKRRIGVYLTVFPHIGGSFQYAQAIIDSLCSFPNEFEIFVFYTNNNWEKILKKYKLNAVSLQKFQGNLQAISETIDNYRCILIFSMNGLLASK